MKHVKLTKGKISKLQQAAVKVSGFIDTLNLTTDERTDLYILKELSEICQAYTQFWNASALWWASCSRRRASL
jgi:hypothetical protein